MFEGLAVLVLALLAAIVVVAKSRDRLRGPGARRSRREDTAPGRPEGGDRDGGDGG